MKDITVEISNMSCGGCIKSIKDALSSKVNSLDIDLETKIAKMNFDENNITENEILRTLDLLGYSSVIK